MKELCIHDGMIKCLALTPNTTLTIHPMDQVIIVAFMRFYRRMLLDQVTVVFEQPEDKLNTRGKRTLGNIMRQTIKSTIFNWASVWQGPKKTSLANG
jgi:hypothetical protein